MLKKIRQYPCIESTVDFQTKDYKIRLWINETSLKEVDDSVIEKLKNVKGSKAEIIDWCADNIPNINAIQVIDMKGRGIVGYTVDFANDPHG